MRIIGLAGPARSGKDTVADYLVGAYGFKKFSFSDKLYEEVAAAFEVEVEELHDPELKDKPWMFLVDCLDRDFYKLAIVKARNEFSALDLPYTSFAGCVSPRFVLQTWGTEYRRAQDPEYWINQARRWLARQMTEVFPDMYRVRVVNTSVRYPNEAQWIRDSGGSVWHVSRLDCPIVREHSSEVPVPKRVGDVTITNDSTIESLQRRVSLEIERYE